MPLDCYSGAVQVDFLRALPEAAQVDHQIARGVVEYLANGSCARSSSCEVKHSTFGDDQGAVALFGLLRLASRRCMLNEL